MNTVYIELVFIDNLLLNFICLLLACVFVKTPKRILRLLAAASIGACYACLVLGRTSFIISLAAKLAVGMLMCAAAFAGKRGFWKNTLSFFITSFILAGCMYALHNSFIENAAVFSPAARAVVLGVCIASVLIIIISRVRKRMLQKHELMFDLKLDYDGKSISVKAFYDTGNMLIEPLSGCGVVFLDKEKAGELFDEVTLGLLEGKGELKDDRLRILPCSTATGQGLLYGIMLDNASAFEKETKAVAVLARCTLSDGVQAMVGNKIMDELKGGSHDDKNVAQNHSVDNAEAENWLLRRLHKRKRSAASTAVKAGRS